MPIGIGLGAFILVCGLTVLDPTNIAWLYREDFATHYLGWLYFKNTAWTLPLGLNPDYGLELASAIVYSDSIPLLAFFFKALSPVLPKVFQYFGIWLLICFLLQAWFAWKLLSLITKDFWQMTLGTILFVFAPPMLYRLGIHIVLVGHFTLLAGLYLYYRPSTHHRVLWWLLLLVSTAFIHAYLLAMVFVFWLADCIDRKPEINRKAFYGSIVATLVALWLAGYFTVGGSINAPGFGYSRMNLLSPIDASGWSYVLPDLPEMPGDHEGFNYLGLGGILLVLMAVLLTLKYRRTEHDRPWRIKALPVFLGGLTLFALSHQIGIGLFNFPTLPLGEHVLKGANILRSSGRMFWPVYYALLYWSLVTLHKRLSQTGTTLTLLFIAALQVSDARAGWEQIHLGLNQATMSYWSTPLKDPFWEEAAMRYTKLRALPLEVDRTRFEQPNDWQIIPYFAATHGLGTDTAYLARYNAMAIQKAEEQSKALFTNGTLAVDTLYLVNPEYMTEVRRIINREHDMLRPVDGYLILAPGWYIHRSPTEQDNQRAR